MLIRNALAIFTMMLIAFPGWANPTAVGTVQSSVDATLRGNSLVAGTSVFGGDTIEVGQQGNVWIAFASGSELVLSANSKVEITDGTETRPIQFEALAGKAKFLSAEKALVTVLLADATIRPKGASAVGFVNVLSPTAAMIGAEKGDLIVSTEHDGATMTIPAGNSVTVRIAQDQNAPTAIHKGKGRVILVGLAIVGVAAGVATALTLNESRKPVSPFKP